MTKRALILSGGSSKSSYQVGVIKYLTEVHKISWDLIAGVSAGGLNAAFLSQYPKQTQVDGAKNLENLWHSIQGNKSVYESWGPSWLPFHFGYLFSPWKSGLYNTKPLEKLISTNFDKNKILNSGVKLLVGATSLTTGKRRFVDETNKEIFDWIRASACYPIAFSPIEIDGDLWIDGDLKKNISPLKEVLMFNPQEIDIITTRPITGGLVPTKINNHKKLIQNILRVFQILGEDVFPIEEVEKCISRGIKINIFAPKEKISINLLDFNPEIIQRLMKQGFEDTKEVLNLSINN